MSIFARNRAHIFSSAFAFYDIQKLRSGNAQSWFNYCIQFSEKAGYPLDQGCCTPGNTKYVLLKNFKKVFEKNMENLLNVELRSEANYQEIGDYGHMYASFDNENKEGFIIGHKESFEKSEWYAIGSSFCKILQPKYAIFYEIPYSYFPQGYDIGLQNNALDINPSHWLFNRRHLDLRNRICKWAQLNKKEFDICSSGHLREVYPINFINENHLRYEVFSKITLKDWILAEDCRGKLEKVTDELWAWIIEESDLEKVTIDLAPSDICLCVNRENPQRYDYGVRPEDQIPIEPWHP